MTWKVLEFLWAIIEGFVKAYLSLVFVPFTFSYIPRISAIAYLDLSSSTCFKVSRVLFRNIES